MAAMIKDRVKRFGSRVLRLPKYSISPLLHVERLIKWNSNNPDHQRINSSQIQRKKIPFVYSFEDFYSACFLLFCSKGPQTRSLKRWVFIIFPFYTSGTHVDFSFFFFSSVNQTKSISCSGFLPGPGKICLQIYSCHCGSEFCKGPSVILGPQRVSVLVELVEVRSNGFFIS